MYEPELMPKFGVGGLGGRRLGGVVLGGGCAAVWRAGGGGGFGLALVGGGRASCVLSLMFSFMYTNKVFFQSLFALLLSAAVSSQVSSFRFFAR